MPRFPIAFGRRKSNANELDAVSGALAEPTFKVFDRENTSKSFDGGVKLANVSTLPSQRPKTSTIAGEDNLFESVYNR